MKKFISFLLVISVIFTAAPLAVSATAVQSTASNDNAAAAEESTTEYAEEIEVTTEVVEETTESTEPTEETTEPTETTEATDPSTDPTTASTEATTASTAPTTKATQPTTVKKVYPAKVKKFKVAQRNTDSIKLTWKKSKKATRYVIYRAREKANGTVTKYKEYKTIYNEKRTNFTDKNLASGRIYKYKIVAYRVKKNYTTHSKASKVKTVTKMIAPSKLKTTKTTTTSISLKWSGVKGARKYLLYRKTIGGTYSLIAKTTDKTYTDSKVATGTSYIYMVKGYRVVSKKEYTSPGKTLTASSSITGVSGVTAKTYARRALLTWSSVSGASGYEIYKVKANGSLKYKESRRYATYLSGKLKAGKTYTFAVKSYKSVNGSKTYGSTKKVSVTISAKAFGKTPSGTYVEICTETQEMFMYVSNKLYCSTPVVTGMYNSQDTTHGYHYVMSRKSPARLRGSANGHSWDVNVTYWLGFTSDGQGIHDSSWRTSGYGGEIYKGDGSNGCVNTPYAAVSKIYAKAYVGMPVIVY